MPRGQNVGVAGSLRDTVDERGRIVAITHGEKAALAVNAVFEFVQPHLSGSGSAIAMTV